MCEQLQTYCVLGCFDAKIRSRVGEVVGGGVGGGAGLPLGDDADRGEVESKQAVYTPRTQLVHTSVRLNPYGEHGRTLGVALGRRCSRCYGSRA